jgi:hypothetical protein
MGHEQGAECCAIATLGALDELVVAAHGRSPQPRCGSRRAEYALHEGCSTGR